jgi:glycosyltransferase involved in cell wall biosynthesis
LAGIIQDQAYYDQYVAPHLDNDRVIYVGSVGPVERNRLLGKAGALLHPIQFDEPFGLSVIVSKAAKMVFWSTTWTRPWRRLHALKRLTAHTVVARLNGISQSTA